MESFNILHGNVENHFFSKAIKKNEKTVRLFESALKKLIDTDWEISERGIWISTGKDERIVDDIEEGLAILQTIRRGAISIALEKKKDLRVFVRWYNSAPQTDVLSFEGEITINNNRLLRYTPSSIAHEVATVFQETFEKELTKSDVKELTADLLESQKRTFDQISQLIQGRS